MILPQSRLSRMTLAALATLLGQAASVYADPVIGATSAAAVASGNGSPSIYQYSLDSLPPYSYLNSSTSISDATGTASGYGFAHTGGAYAVHSNVEGTGNGSAHAQFVNRFQNLSGVAQHYTLSFHIYGGSISAYSNGYRSLVSGETITASYAASVKVSVDDGANWDTKFSSGATITTNETGTTATRSGTALYLADDPITDVLDGSYSWSNAYYTVDLGVIDAGAYFDVQANVDTSALANVGVYSFNDTCSSYGGYGYGSYGYTTYPCERTEFVGRANGFYGDPIEPFGSALMANDPDGFVLRAGELPEPASLALLGLAVGAAGVARRRRSDKAG